MPEPQLTRCHDSCRAATDLTGRLGGKSTNARPRDQELIPGRARCRNHWLNGSTVARARDVHRAIAQPVSNKASAVPDAAPDARFETLPSAGAGNGVGPSRLRSVAIGYVRQRRARGNRRGADRSRASASIGFTNRIEIDTTGVPAASDLVRLRQGGGRRA